MKPTYSAPHLGLTYDSITDPDTVARNWRGEITPEQESRVQLFVRQARQSAVLTSLAAAGFLIMVGFTVNNFWPMLASSRAIQLNVWMPIAIFAVLAVIIEAVLLGSALRSWSRMQQMADDLATRRIATGEGEVEWGRGLYGIKAYVAKVDGQALQTPAYSLQLPPGRYRFAYLASSGWLLSAEPISVPSASNAPAVFAAAPASEALTILARQHGFSLADLDANRRGQLSARQRRNLLGKGLGLAAAALFVLLVASVLTLGMALPGVIGGLAIAPSPGGLILTLGGWVGFVLLVAAARRTLSTATEPNPLRSHSGLLTVRYQREYRSMRVFYKIGRVECELSNGMLQRQAYNSVIERNPYRVYYLARTGALLSLEPLETAP